MRNSVGKSVARDHLYVSVRQWLTEEQLLSGKFLVLLGKEALEVPYLDRIGIPRENITCVERDIDAFEELLALSLGVHLTRCDVTQFLNRSLHDDYRFVVLNLDIEGQYRSGLDPAMSSVLLYCCRNPHTVVATYNSIGRDVHTVWEGAKSLALLLWLLPEETREAFARISWLYGQHGYETPAKCALRELFWIRSLLEHALRASSALFASAKQALEEMSAQDTILWKRISAPANRSLRLDHVEAFVQSMPQAAMIRAFHEPGIYVELSRQRHIIYRAADPWSQRCYYSRFSLLAEPQSVLTWLRSFLKTFLDEPFLFIDREGLGHEMRAAQAPGTISRTTVLEEGREIYNLFKPRVLAPFAAQRWLTTIQRVHLELQLRKVEVPMAKKKPSVSRPASASAAKQPMLRGGELTEHGRTEARRLAAEGFTTEEICDSLNLHASKTAERSVRAFVARARRPAMFAAGVNGKLSDHGQSFIAALAKRGLSFEEMIKHIPDTVEERYAKKAFDAAKRS